MRPTHRGAAPKVLVTLSLMIASACSSGSHSTGVPTAPTTGPTETVLVLGGSATEGDGVPNRLQEAWPYLVFHEALPLSTVFVNGALDGATVDRALIAQVPIASELKPDIVEVWLGADDLLAHTPVAEFGPMFTNLITSLRNDGAQRVLVADLPPAYGPAAAAYNVAIHAAVAATHAELVPLTHASITLKPTDGLTPQPDTASHRVIATAFETEIKSHK